MGFYPGIAYWIHHHSSLLLASMRELQVSAQASNLDYLRTLPRAAGR